jgi:hypothetical protein
MLWFVFSHNPPEPQFEDSFFGRGYIAIKTLGGIQPLFHLDPNEIQMNYYKIGWDNHIDWMM